MQLVVEHKHRIGFKGLLLIEPKPAEPTKHQYDFDVATVYGFLKANGLEKEIKVNVEQNHALLAGHSFEHEIALAQALGVFGSIDMTSSSPTRARPRKRSTACSPTGRRCSRKTAR